MILGYNTNGLAHHSWQDGLQLLADIGYRSVAVTVDHNLLNPFSDRHTEEVSQFAEVLRDLGLKNVIETGARFLLDPRRKHEPTLMSPTAEERDYRVDFLKRCVDLAAQLNSDAVSFWSGILREDLPRDRAMQRLADGCREVADYAARRDVTLAFEPEPGMFIESFIHFAELDDLVGAPHFGLTVDIGHVQCVETEPIADCLRQWRGRIHNIHIEDMCRGVHEHLRFGEGEIDFPPVIAALREIDYSGGLHVELSRHSHMAPQVARESYDFLSSLL